MATEKRLIYVDEALEKLRNAERNMKVVSIVGIKAVSIDAFIQFLENRKTVDAVEVVRCKDCKYRYGTPGQPNILCYQMKDDDFCSYGERRDNGKTD